MKNEKASLVKQSGYMELLVFSYRFVVVFILETSESFVSL